MSGRAHSFSRSTAADGERSEAGALLTPEVEALRVDAYALRANAVSRDVLRRFSYHVRFRRGSAMFARAWLLVEGETEFWLTTEVSVPSSRTSKSRRSCSGAICQLARLD